MIENVTIVDNNGNGILAEGIMYANIKTMVDSATSETGKDYIFYCLNEMVDSEQTKIYISEASTVPGNTNPIGDVEWRKITDLLLAISHKEAVTNVEYKKMTGMTFHVSTPKKLAIKLPVKQALKDAYFTGVLAVQENATTQGTPVLVDKDLVGNEQTTNNMAADVNAFSATPVMMTNAANETKNNEQSGVVPRTPIVIQTGATQINLDTSIPASPDEQRNNSGTTVNNLVEPVLQEEPPLLPPDVESVQPSGVDIQEGITLADAEKALDVLNNYFKSIHLNKTSASSNHVEAEVNAPAINAPAEKEEEAVVLPDYSLPEVVPVPNTLEVIPVAAVNQEIIPSSEPETAPAVLNEGNGGTATTIQVIPSEQKNEEVLIQDQGATGFIDTSVSGLSAQTQQTILSGNDLASVNFNIPDVQPNEVATVDALQPITSVPSLFEPSIPLVDPVTPAPQDNQSYVHVAGGNRGITPINTGTAQTQNMPPVQMPDNAVGVKEATSKMLEQGNLGPSGLS